MAEMHNDPERLRQFAATLGSSTERIIEDMDQIKAAVARLGSSFRDQGYQEFQTHHQAAHAAVQQFKAECDRIRPELLKDADNLEAYLRIHMGR